MLVQFVNLPLCSGGRKHFSIQRICHLPFKVAFMVKLHTKCHLKCLIAKGYILRCYDANLIEQLELSTDDKTEGVVGGNPHDEIRGQK